VFDLIVGCCPRTFLFFNARTIAFFDERKNRIAPGANSGTAVYNLGV
jgi:hypothetical protein